MRDDEATEALNKAIEEAYRLNNNALVALEKAIKGTPRGLVFEDDYRYKHAMQMLQVCARQHGVAMRYFLTRSKKLKAAARTGR